MRGKFFVEEIRHYHTENPADAHVDVILAPVQKGNGEWTRGNAPVADLRLTITNPQAANAFDIAQHYYVDFSRVPDE